MNRATGIHLDPMHRMASSFVDRSVYHRNFIAVDGMPCSGFGKNIGERRPTGNDQIFGWVRIEKILPAGLEVNRLQVRLQKRLAIKIVPVVDNNLGPRIKAVDEVSAPGVRCKKRPSNISLFKIIGRRHGKSFLTELCVKVAATACISTVEDKPSDDNHGRQRPHVPAHFDRVNTLKESHVSRRLRTSFYLTRLG